LYPYIGRTDKTHEVLTAVNIPWQGDFGGKMVIKVIKWGKWKVGRSPRKWRTNRLRS